MVKRLSLSTFFLQIMLVYKQFLRKSLEPKKTKTQRELWSKLESLYPNVVTSLCVL